jgi:hypothetical protein
MCLKTRTKEALINYISDELGHCILNHKGNDLIDSWEIECCECNTPNIIRVDSLKQIRRKRQNIICVGCKHGKKVDNFLTKNEMTFVQSYNDGNILIECDDCKAAILLHR